MAGTTGLEPATSAVTGQRSNQLNYVPLDFLRQSRKVLPFAGCWLFDAGECPGTNHGSVTLPLFGL